MGGPRLGGLYPPASGPVRLAGAARHEEDCHESQHRVAGHHEEQRTVASDQIEEAAVHRIADCAPERYTEYNRAAMTPRRWCGTGSMNNG